jgi:hypothetical protein
MLLSAQSADTAVLQYCSLLFFFFFFFFFCACAAGFSLSLSLNQNRILGPGWIQGVCADILSHT